MPVRFAQLNDLCANAEPGASAWRPLPDAER